MVFSVIWFSIYLVVLSFFGYLVFYLFGPLDSIWWTSSVYLYVCVWFSLCLADIKRLYEKLTVSRLSKNVQRKIVSHPLIYLTRQRAKNILQVPSNPLPLWLQFLHLWLKSRGQSVLSCEKNSPCFLFLFKVLQIWPNILNALSHVV